MAALCEFSVVFLGVFFVCFGGLFWSREASDDPPLSVNCDSRVISIFGSTAAANSCESAGIVDPNPAISAIFGVGTHSKVDSSIIERVVVYVISPLLAATSRYNVAHINDLHLPVGIMDAPLGVKTPSSNVPLGVPVPLREALKVLSINNSVLALRKWNQAVGWIERLTNGVPCKRLSGHFLTSNENLLPVAILAYRGAQ